MKKNRVLMPEGEVVKTAISNKTEKFYNLLMAGAVCRCVVDKATAVRWRKDKVKVYRKAMGMDPSDDLFQIVEIKRRRIK